jgi:hypothetical protein
MGSEVDTIFAIDGSEMLKPPPYGGAKDKGLGEGASVNIPTAVNCT